MTLGLSDDEDGPNDLVRVSCRTRYPEKGTRGTMVTEKKTWIPNLLGLL